MGSPSEEMLDFNRHIFSGTEYGGISIDNVLFAESNIRYYPPSYKAECTTHAYSVSNRWTSTLNCRSVVYVLNTIPSDYLNLCIHELAYSTCKDCKDKGCKGVNITPFQILDSGASLYFSGNRSDFTTFETLHMPIPIHIANRTTFITGKDSVVLKHLSIDTKEVITNLEPVFFCKDLTYQLLSLGAFLQDSFSVQGKKDLIIVNMCSGAEFMFFKPKMANDTIYILQILDWVKKC